MEPHRILPMVSSDVDVLAIRSDEGSHEETSKKYRHILAVPRPLRTVPGPLRTVPRSLRTVPRHPCTVPRPPCTSVGTLGSLLLRCWDP